MTNRNVKAEVSNEQLMQLILKLQAENQSLKAGKPADKPKEIHMDNLGRMSVPLAGSVNFAFYLDQWDKFAPQIENAKAFIKANRAKMPNEETRKAAAAKRKQVEGK